MIKSLFLSFFKSSKFLFYFIYDFIKYKYIHQSSIFSGWGIHLYVGKFGSGKTASAVRYVYEQCLKYKDLSVVTNIRLQNFPLWTKIYELNTEQDILNAPISSIVLIDEIGTIFNSRDFSSKKSLSKSLFQHLCQCRKRRMQIVATVQKYNLLDKQIRDISATVTSCKCSFSYPFTRLVRTYTYDSDEYEMYMSNRMYRPRLLKSDVYIQSNKYRQLYDTSELVDNLLNKEYISDEEILRNRSEINVNNVLYSKKERRKINRL